MELSNNQPDKRICRTCLRVDTDENLFYLFPKDVSEENLLIPEMISKFSDIPINEGDAYPNQVCKKCYEDVKISYNFKKQCEKSHEVLTAIIEKYRKNPQNETGPLESKFVSEMHVKLEETQSSQQNEILFFYNCEKCNQKLINFESLEKHVNECHQTNLKCRICLKDCLNDETIETSSIQLEFKLNDAGVCSACNKFYQQNGNSNQYEGEETKDGSSIPWQFMCAVCAQTFTTEESLKSHPCEENNSLKSDLCGEIETNDVEEDDGGDDNDEIENPLEDDLNLSTKILNSEIESCNDDNDDDQDDYSSDESKTPPAENEKTDSLESTEGKMCKNNKKLRKFSRRKGKIHKCDICNKIFSRSTHLRRHTLTHLEEKPYACKVCNKGFTRLDHLNLHMHNHSDIKPHICDICERGFTRAEHLRKHKEARHGDKIKTPKTEFCDICQKGFTTAKYLHIHMRSHTDRIWSCKSCSEKFKTKPELTAHSKAHAANEKPYLCSECGLRFVRNDYLVIHMRRHKGEKPYKCKYCGKGFPRATDLTVHERYHTGEKTHLCTICGKGFQRAYNLLVHTRVHTGERPYECPHCTKRFAQGNDLKAHIRRHTGERFKCEICGDGFIQGYHLTQHKRSVHGIDMKSHIRRVEKFVTPIEQQKQMEALQNQIQNNKPELNESEECGEIVECGDDGNGILVDENCSKHERHMITEMEIIKIEQENMEMTEAISISSEQAEMLESGQSIAVVEGNSIAMITYYNPSDQREKTELISE